MESARRNGHRIDVFEEDSIDPLFSEEDIMLAGRGCGGSTGCTSGDNSTNSGSVVFAPPMSEER